MRPQIFLHIIVLCFAILLSGCTHHFLLRNTTKQASTISDVLIQQVMDNIALFSANPHALPHFAVLSDGTSQAVDQTTPAGSLTWNARTITAEMLSINANRQLLENWKMAPVTSAGRLKRMRCALQFVVNPPAFAVEEVQLPIGSFEQTFFVVADDPCTKCLAELTKMQLFPKPDSKDLVSGAVLEKSGRYYFKSQEMANKYVSQLIAARECNFPNGWYCWGCKKPPKGACYVGHCGKMYAWVTADGMDELSRLTITLLTLATVDPITPMVTVKRRIKGPTGEEMTVEGQVPGDVINFRLPRLIPDPALKQAADRLLLQLNAKRGTATLRTFDQATGGDLEALLNELKTEEEISAESAARLHNLLNSLDKLRTQTTDLVPADFDALDEIRLRLEAAPIEPPSEPSILDQPGFMPFSHPSSGAEFVPSSPQ
jgi:hypothetical protein